jgi:hypothetical protein
VNQREREDRDADESRNHHADAAQNKAEHGFVPMVLMKKKRNRRRGLVTPVAGPFRPVF